jgi:hypothetical protein
VTPAEKLPLSPMLVQYLVGLCVLKWNANAVNVDITLGDMVPDEASGTKRDVDVTVTADTPDGMYAFKGYEVKHWASPLNVADVDGLTQKLKDMPSVTHRAIVSTSGFTESAISKAKYHGVDLYVIRPWTRPLAEQFPDLAPMSGLPSQVINTLNMNLVWPVQHYWLGLDGGPPNFEFERGTPLFDANGGAHAGYRDFGAFAEAIVVRSTGILWPLKPMMDHLDPYLMAFRERGTLPEEPQWPHAHTLDVARDEVYMRPPNQQLHRVDTFTLCGELKWERTGVLYNVMEKVPTGEAFAGAIVGLSDVPGRMWVFIFPAEGREIQITRVQLEQRHLNSIRDLKPDLAHVRGAGVVAAR